MTAEAAVPLPPLPPRAPRQERGQRRVHAILDATAALIAAEGVESVTMHRVARASGTTTGSMYHFFPEREALLGALVGRHACALRELTARVEQEVTACAPRSTDEAVARLLDPFLTYSEAHPDLLPLARLARASAWGADRDAELARLVVRLSRAVAASRDPDAAPAELDRRADAMAAMIDGVASAVARMRRAPAGAPIGAPVGERAVRALRGELRRALVAYLDSYARSPGARSRSR